MALLLLTLAFLSCPSWTALPESDTNDETALLRAIQAHPDEDTPRLAYADWLDENNRPLRAEFIRLQIQLARLGPNEDKRALQARERELLRNPKATGQPKLFIDALRIPRPPSGDRTGAALYKLVLDNPDTFFQRMNYSDHLEEHERPEDAAIVRQQVEACLRIHFRRGFLEGIAASENWLAQHGSEAFQASPFLRSVNVLPRERAVVSMMPGVITALIQSDVTPQLHALSFRGEAPTNGQIVRLMPHLRSLRTLHVTDSVLPSLASEIFSSNQADHLKKVDLVIDPLDIVNVNTERQRLREVLARFSQRPHALVEVSESVRELLPSALKAKVAVIPSTPCADVLNAFGLGDD